jgi:hypothetical protein
VGLEWMFFIARSLELRALPYAFNLPPRAAASFNKRARGGGGTAVLFHVGRSRPAAPERQCC